MDFSGNDRGDEIFSKGFTKTDLIVVVGTCFLLATIQAGVHSRSSQFGNTLQCQTNLRLLGQGWMQYAADHSGYMPGNEFTFGFEPGEYWTQGRMSFSGEEAINTELVTSGQLGAYVDDPQVYRCPSDASVVDLRTEEGPLPRARSYAANHAVGTQQDGRTPVNGLWLDGIPDHEVNETYRTFGNVAQILTPSPKDLFLLVDEHPDSINDTVLVFSMVGGRNTRIIDFPGSYHSLGANFVFAEGHVQTHRWQDRRTTPPVTYTGDLQFNVSTPDNPDMAWLAEHTSSEIP